MNCPNCGKEMERGWIYSGGRPLIWSKTQGKVTILAGKNDVCLRSMFEKIPEGWICRDCQMAIIPYGHKGG